MAENVPPTSSAADPTRGLPYYEQLKKQLFESLNKKRLLDRKLATIEDEIHRCEGNYLEETSAGNIIKGFESYIKGSTATTSTTTGGGTSTRRKGTAIDQDRVFSRSSASYMRESPPPSSTQTTPSHVPTPSGSLSRRDSGNQPTPTSATSTQPGGTKKKKKTVDKEEDVEEQKTPKRYKVSYARGEKGPDG